MLAIIPKQHIKQTIKHPIILFLPIFAFALPILCQLNISEKMIGLKLFQINLTEFNISNQISIRFSVQKSTTLSTLFVIASFDKWAVVAFNIKRFHHQKAQNINEYDLDAIGESRDQYINLISNNSELLYLGVYNWDPNYRKKDTNFTIDITEDFRCQKCSNGESYGNKCWCNGCQGVNFGKICSKSFRGMGNEPVKMKAGEFLYYEIGGRKVSQISVQIKVIGEVEVYMQFKTYDGETSNYYNSDKEMNTQLQNRTQRYIINSHLQVLLITIASLVPSYVTLNEFQQSNPIDLVVVIVASIGALFAVMLTLVVLCILRKNGSARVGVQGQAEMKLNEAEIQRYFPKCLLQDIATVEFKIVLTDLTTMQFLENQPTNSLSIHMPSTTPSLLNEPNADPIYECAICLQQILGNDLVRISFCKHIFHDQCLIKWFNKQTNCPYCRKNYSREKTIQDYQQIVKSGGKELDGVELCRAISKKKLSFDGISG